MTYNETTQLNINDLEEVEENEVPEELIRKVEEFEEKPKPNLVKTEVVNLGNLEVVQETRVSIHMTENDKKEYTECLMENKDIFAWSYADITGLSTSIVAHRLPTDPACPLVKQKLRHYLSSHTTYLISRMDPLKYIFQKPMPIGKLAKWQILLSEFDIMYVTQKGSEGTDISRSYGKEPCR